MPLSRITSVANAERLQPSRNFFPRLGYASHTAYAEGCICPASANLLPHQSTWHDRPFSFPRLHSLALPQRMHKAWDTVCMQVTLSIRAISLLPTPPPKRIIVLSRASD
jgi:hypothetical protein